MALNPKPLVPRNNYDILNRIRHYATSDYQRRVPEATKANLQETMQKILGPGPQRNEFIDALVNRIGLVIGKHQTWTNPLAKFKRGMLSNGDTIEEVMTGLIQSKAYDPRREYMEREVWGQELPDVQASFHKINREEYYKMTINEVMLRRAFLPQDEFGLHNFTSQLMASATTSDQWDEFLAMTSLFAEFEKNGGFFNVNVPDAGAITSDRLDTNALLRAIRAQSSQLQFISDNYNPAHMPVAARPEDLELFITPEVDAALSVESLAAAFNVDHADVYTRKTVIPEDKMGIPGTQAILSTRDLFVVADTFMDTREVSNPAGLYSNYFFHHHQIISMSRFEPAIRFSTDPSTPIIIADTPVTDVTAPKVYDYDQETSQFVEVTGALTRGKIYALDAAAVTTPEGGVNDAVRYEITGLESWDSTYDQRGTLVIGFQEKADEITITAISTDNNSEASTTVKLVDGDRAVLWPNPEVVPEGEGEEPDPEA